MSTDCGNRDCLNHPTGPDTEEEAVEATEDSSSGEEEETDPTKYLVTKITRRYVIIATRYWRIALYGRDQCGRIPTQHYHPIFDPHVDPYEALRTVKLWLCTSSECPAAGTTHAH
jgi:hypothetical protein